MPKRARTTPHTRPQLRQAGIDSYSYATKPASANNKTQILEQKSTETTEPVCHLGKRKRGSSPPSAVLDSRQDAKSSDEGTNKRQECDDKQRRTPGHRNSTIEKSAHKHKQQSSFETPAAKPSNLDCLRTLLRGFQSMSKSHKHEHTQLESLELDICLRWLAPSWERGVLTASILRKFIHILNLAIRRVDASASEYEFVVYGGRIMLQKPGRLSMLSSSVPIPDEDEGVQRSYDDILTKKWDDWIAETENEIVSDTEETEWLNELPLATIKRAFLAPKFMKGRELLESLKVPNRGDTEHVPTSSSLADESPVVATLNRSKNLLDRINAKKSVKQRSDTPKAVLEKDAAVKRIEVILPHLFHRTSNTTRAAESMKQVISRIQESSRCPLSSREIEQSLGILAQEIAPGFVKFVEHGGIKCVVLDHSRRPLVLHDKRSVV